MTDLGHVSWVDIFKTHFDCLNYILFHASPRYVHIPPCFPTYVQGVGWGCNFQVAYLDNVVLSKRGTLL